MYLEAFKKYNEDDDEPYAKDNYDYKFCDTYCYILGYYYIRKKKKSIED